MEELKSIKSSVQTEISKLPLPKDLILSAISAPDENTYCAVFYLNTEKKEKIYILNKSVS
jgi:hypothetical protein